MFSTARHLIGLAHGYEFTAGLAGAPFFRAFHALAIDDGGGRAGFVLIPTEVARDSGMISPTIPI